MRHATVPFVAGGHGNSYETPSKASTLVRAWVFFCGTAAWVLAVVMAFRAELTWAVACVMGALVADTVGRLWSRTSPVPMPYFMRWVLLLPRGPHSPQRLLRMLQPRPGERILELGPGIGVHALPVASSLAPGGVLDVLDVQRAMLNALLQRAAQANVRNIVASQADAQALPYDDHSFDAAFPISVLGELPDASKTLRELRRVLKREGRLVIGEVLLDPDFISLRRLTEKARQTGFTLERTVGPRFFYFALFRPTAVAAEYARAQNSE